MPNDTPEPITPATPVAPTPVAAVNNTAANPPGTGTEPAQPQAQEDKKFTQADLDRHLQTRLKSAVKAELKRMSGDDEGKPTVDDLQRQLSETKTRAQAIEARESVRDYLSDPVHKLNVKAENVAAIVKLVVPDLDYDDEGKPANLKDAVNSARTIAPALFANSTPSINAAQGRNGNVPASGMDDMIRRSAGYGS